MTGRSTPEWIGATPDTAIPVRVRVRVFERAGGHCEACGRRIAAGDSWQADHTVALCNGGENREGNLRCLCDWCHAGKTRTDVAEKASVYRKRVKHLGVRQSRNPVPGSRNTKWKRCMDGTTVRRSGA